MRFSSPKQHERSNHHDTCTLAKSLAPEEVRRGQFVAILHVIDELPSFLWDADATLLPYDEPVRIRFVSPGGGVPLKVKSVCLPFVLVKAPTGDNYTLDLRRYRLARLNRSYAQATWKAFKSPKAQSQPGVGISSS